MRQYSEAIHSHILAFESTHLLRGTTLSKSSLFDNYFISIHAPPERYDMKTIDLPEDDVEFQSTHLLRGTTLIGPIKDAPILISIHAPPERYDHT